MYAYSFDGDTRSVGSVWYRMLNEQEMSLQANRITNHGYSAFNPTHGFVVTWDRVQWYLKKSCYNTFQMSYLTDGTRTYFICAIISIFDTGYFRISHGWTDDYENNWFYYTPSNCTEYVFDMSPGILIYILSKVIFVVWFNPSFFGRQNLTLITKTEITRFRPNIFLN
jgi:hypothetical protein